MAYPRCTTIPQGETGTCGCPATGGFSVPFLSGFPEDVSFGWGDIYDTAECVDYAGQGTREPRIMALSGGTITSGSEFGKVGLVTIRATDNISLLLCSDWVYEGPDVPTDTGGTACNVYNLNRTSQITPPASLYVNVVDENNEQLPGAAWGISYANGLTPPNPVTGSGISTTHTVYPRESGDIFSVSGWPSTLGTRTFLSATNSDGGGSSLVISPGQAKSVTLKYQTSAAVPCTIDLQANGSNGPVSVASGSGVALTWTSSNANSTSGNGFSSGGATQNGSGVLVYPTVNTTYSISGTSNGGNCSDSVSVTVTTPPPGGPTVDVKGNGSDGPVTLISGQNLTVSWIATNAVFCEYTSPFSSGLAGLSGSDTFYPGHPYYPSASGTTYEVRCRNASNVWASDSVTVSAPVVGNPPSVDLRADGSNGPLSVSSGSYPTLSWTTTNNPTSCTGSSGWSGSKTASGGSQTVGPITGTVTYTITCSNASGSSSDSVTVNVGVPPTPPSSVAVLLLANGSAVPITISSGASVTLSWSTDGGPTSCGANSYALSSSQSPLYGWSGSKTPSGGSQVIGPIYQTGYYELTCSNGVSSGADSIQINVSTAGPNVNLSVSPSSLESGQATTINWTTSNVTSCTASASPSNGQWSGAIALSGSRSITLTQTTVFTLTCTGAGGTGQDMETVSVFGPPVITFSANPTSVPFDGSTILSWIVKDANYCDAYASPNNGQWSGGIDHAKPNLAPEGYRYTKTIYNLTSDTTFYISCQGNWGDSEGSTSVTVTPAATLTVSSNRSTSWTLASANPQYGTGTFQSHSIFPSASGSVYTLSGIANISGYTYTVTNSQGSGSSLTMFPGNSASYTITYSPSGPAFDYRLSNNGNVAVTKGASTVNGQSQVTANLVSGTPQPVSFSVTGVPSGVSVSYGNQNCSPTCTATITFAVSPSAPVGTYPITVSGLSGTEGRTTNFNLIINAPASLSVTCTPSPSPAYIGQPVTWTANVSGGTSPYTYAWSGTNFSGTPTTNPYVFTYQTTGAKVATVTVNDGGGQTAACPASTLQVGVDPQYIEF